MSFKFGAFDRFLEQRRIRLVLYIHNELLHLSKPIAFVLVQ
jgi:hypothetical protein